MIPNLNMQPLLLELKVGSVVDSFDVSLAELVLRWLQELDDIRSMHYSHLSMFHVDLVSPSVLDLYELVSTYYKPDERLHHLFGFVNYFNVCNGYFKLTEHFVF
jgi:hypothetical protein